MRDRLHRFSSRHTVAGLGLVCALALTACEAVPDVPLDPQASEAGWLARSLQAPELSDFLCRNGCPQAAGPEARFDLRALTLAAVFGHPDLRVAEATLHEAQAGVITAGAIPNPNVSAAYEADRAPTSPWTLAFVTEFTLETGGRRSERLRGAESRVQAALLRFGQSVWEARVRVRAALLEHQLASQEAALLQDKTRAAGQVSKLLEQRLSAGEAAPFEVSRARDELARDQLAVARANSRAAEARVALAAAVGVPLAALDSVQLAWPELESPPDPALLPETHLHQAGVLDRLDVRAALADYETAQADLQLEAAKRWPNITLGPGYTLEKDANRFTFAIGALDLPLFDQNEGPLAAARARRESAAAALLALQANVLSQTDAARERYAGAMAELSAAGTLSDAAELRARSARRALELGAGDALDLALANDELLLTRQQRLDALGRAQSALGDLEEAVQRPLLAEGEDADALAGTLLAALPGAAP